MPTQVLVLCAGSEQEMERLAPMLRKDGTEPFAVDDPAHAKALITANKIPDLRAVLVLPPSADYLEFMAWLRGASTVSFIPVVFAVPDYVPDAFEQAHSLGADDVVVLGDLEGIRTRMRQLARVSWGNKPPLRNGRAIIAHPDMHRRRIIGRVMRQAGFDLVFAEDMPGLLDVASRADQTRLTVVAADLAPEGGLHAVQALREQSDQAALPAVVVGSRGRELDWTGDLPSRVALVSEEAPVDTVLFQANELCHPDVRNLRSSERLLFHSLSRYRVDGRGAPVWGLTYNISREGIYVRTLVCPTPQSHVWLEMELSESTTVHLRADVVWVNTPERGPQSSPVGFAVRLVESACPPSDLSIYQQCYDRLLRHRKRPTRRFSLSPPFDPASIQPPT